MLESTDVGSSNNTGQLLLRMWTAIAGTPDPHTFEFVHHALRKTGHFTGYAILSFLIFRALRATWRAKHVLISVGREYFWQLRWAALAVGGTLLAASVDEFHQYFNPDRTGRWQDVVIDTSGALVLQFILYVISQRRNRDREALA
jgi:VanZ family protein